MNLKKLVVNSLFIGVAAILHQITPPIVLGIKPDFTLAMLFIIMILNEDYKTCMISGVVIGIISAATTGFPGGQVPNFIDKIITTNVMYLVLMPLRNKFNKQINVIVTTVLGTVVSGVVFLYMASLMVGLPASFKVLVMSAVLPATLINGVAAFVLFNAIYLAMKRSSIRV